MESTSSNKSESNAEGDVSRDVLCFFHDLSAILDVPKADILKDFPWAMRTSGPRIPWPMIVALYNSLDRFGDSERIVELGEQVASSKSLGLMTRILRLVANSTMLYKTVFNWAGPRIFPHIESGLEVLPGGRLRTHLRIPDTYDPCRNFFRVHEGSMRTLPRILGLKDAHVHVSQLSGRHQVLLIDPPPSMTIAARVKQLINLVFNIPLAIRELGDQRLELRQQFRELKVAYDRVSEQSSIAQNALHDAEKALDVKNQFLAVIGHELRTPLNGICGAATCLKDESDPVAATELHEMLDESTQNLTDLVDGILQYCEMADGKARKRNDRFSFRRLQQETLRGFKSKAEDKGLSLSVRSLVRSHEFIDADIDRLGIAIRALLDNAIKFTLEGAVTTEFSLVGNAETKTKLRVVVSDTGIGIPAGVQEKIFGRFFQVEQDSTRQFQGSGIGLSICEQITTLLGGALTVESECGRGSTFTLEVPVSVTTMTEPVRCGSPIQASTKDDVQQMAS